jgi:hypothetical protein
MVDNARPGLQRSPAASKFARYVKITPDADLFTGLDGGFQGFGSFFQICSSPKELLCKHWDREKLERPEAGYAPEKRLGDQRVTADGLLQRGGNFHCVRLNPAFGRWSGVFGGEVHAEKPYNPG